MPHPRRMYEHKSVYFVTNRLSEGLPFVPNLYVNLVLIGIIARAIFRFPGISVCTLLFMTNHYHGIFVTNGDPAQFKDFMNYVDGEIAKVVVRFLDKRNVKVWAQRYHAAKLLTWEDVIKKIIYIYINPVQALFVKKASEWTGVSTYQAMFEEDETMYKWIKPSLLPKLPDAPFSQKLLTRLVDFISKLEAPSYLFRTTPFCWKECFEQTKNMTDAELRKKILEKISEEERECEKERKASKKSIVGIESLSTQNPHKYYKPKKFGRRVFCISSCEELRKQYIELYQEFCQKAKDAWQGYMKGFPFTAALFPPGAYLPSGYSNASLLSVVT